jgi:hypothetical protein
MIDGCANTKIECSNEQKSQLPCGVPTTIYGICEEEKSSEEEKKVDSKSQKEEPQQLHQES